jgi:DNA-binding CsgD family transcriptional regulator
MLTVETIGRIRREHFIKGKTIREISRDLKVSRNKVIDDERRLTFRQ